MTRHHEHDGVQPLVLVMTQGVGMTPLLTGDSY